MGRGVMFTFSFNYVNVFGAEDNVEFCASFYDEAEELFEDYCIENNINAVIDSWTVTYNESDADYYGANYGTPEQYYMMAA